MGSWSHLSIFKASNGRTIPSHIDLSDLLLFFLLLVRSLVITLVPTRYSGIISLFEGQLINILNSSVTFISFSQITHSEVPEVGALLSTTVWKSVCS